MVHVSRRRIVIFAAVAFLSIAFYIAVIWRSAQKAIDAGAASAAHAGEIAITVAPWRASAARFEPVLPATDFNSTLEFAGDIYKLAPGSLASSSRVWTVGRDLPPAALLSMAVRTGAGEPELWITTEGAGVLIFDGKAFRQLLPSLDPLRKISALLPLPNGQVLLGTPTAGLYVTDGKVLRLFHPSFAKSQVTALAGDEDRVWVGTRSEGAWEWKGGTAGHVLTGLPDPQVLSIATRGDSAWIGTPLGVTEVVGGKVTRQLGQGLFARTVSEHEGSLQVATLDEGTFSIPLQVRRPHPQHAEVAESITHQSPPQHITALHHDGHGNLWIGYFDRGLDILSVRGIDHREDDHLFCINRIRESNGNVAVATANGLALFDGSTKLRQVLDRESGLIASQVTDVLFSKGSTVVATPAGLSFVDSGVASIFAFHGLVNNHVYTLAELDGTLYAGTLGGISEVRNGLVEASFTTANSQLHQNWITASEVFSGKLYLGTYGSGVIAFDKAGVVTTFPAFAKTRTEVNLNAMLATSAALYAGTSGRGLAVLRPGDPRWLFFADGLPSLNVTALEYYSGSLYIGTDNGLVQISEKQLLP